jgi:hypothetical protein
MPLRSGPSPSSGASSWIQLFVGVRQRRRLSAEVGELVSWRVGELKIAVTPHQLMNSLTLQLRGPSTESRLLVGAVSLQLRALTSAGLLDTRAERSSATTAPAARRWARWRVLERMWDDALWRLSSPRSSNRRAAGRTPWPARSRGQCAGRARNGNADVLCPFTSIEPSSFGPRREPCLRPHLQAARKFMPGITRDQRVRLRTDRQD